MASGSDRDVIDCRDTIGGLPARIMTFRNETGDSFYLNATLSWSAYTVLTVSGGGDSPEVRDTLLMILRSIRDRK
jgi:hypothetical protein